MSEAPRPRPGDERPGEAQRRRRRVRVTDPPGTASTAGSVNTTAAGQAGDPAAVASAQTPAVLDEPSTWTAPEVETVAVERGLRGIVGGGTSQVSPGAALRARDAARPRPADLARAEAELTIVRRNWTPRD